MTRADPQEALIRSIASDLKRLAELEELLMRGHAERLGIHVTDVRCLVALAADDESPSTAGKLAELLALSTGAVTAMLDRLEKMGLVRREKSPDDRRQVLVRLADDGGAHAKEASEVWLRTARRALDDVEPAEAKRLRGVLDALIFGFSEEVERVRGAAAEPRHDVREVVLRIARGGQKIVIDAAAPDGELVIVRDGQRAPLKGKQGPDISIKNDVVTVSGPLLPLRKGKDFTLSLSPSVRWRLEVNGTGLLLEGQLQELDVRAVDIVGGAHMITLRMGSPRSAVPIRLLGGASQLTVLRPRSAHTRVAVRDGTSAADFDGKSLVAVGGDASLQSAGFSVRAPHYDVEIKGGASHATVGIS